MSAPTRKQAHPAALSCFSARLDLLMRHPSSAVLPCNTPGASLDAVVLKREARSCISLIFASIFNFVFHYLFLFIFLSCQLFASLCQPAIQPLCEVMPKPDPWRLFDALIHSSCIDVMLGVAMLSMGYGPSISRVLLLSLFPVLTSRQRLQMTAAYLCRQRAAVSFRSRPC